MRSKRSAGDAATAHRTEQLIHGIAEFTRRARRTPPHRVSDDAREVAVSHPFFHHAPLAIHHPVERHSRLLIQPPLGEAAVSYTHLRAHETPEHLVCRL